MCTRPRASPSKFLSLSLFCYLDGWQFNVPVNDRTSLLEIVGRVIVHSVLNSPCFLHHRGSYWTQIGNMAMLEDEEGGVSTRIQRGGERNGGMFEYLELVVHDHVLPQKKLVELKVLLVWLCTTGKRKDIISLPAIASRS